MLLSMDISLQIIIPWVDIMDSKFRLAVLDSAGTFLDVARALCILWKTIAEYLHLAAQKLSS